MFTSDTLTENQRETVQTFNTQDQRSLRSLTSVKHDANHQNCGFIVDNSSSTRFL